jgi:hypothetical protein
MGYHQRRLPHWEVIGQPLFVTFRLHGSLPTQRVFPPARMTSGRAFVVMDRLLDQPTGDPLFLRRPEIAGVVVQALPAVTTQQWLGPRKGFTAHQANRILGRHGPFWQEESYDHLIRDDREFHRVQRYIEHNLVRAGLVALPEESAWSSAAPGRRPAAG